MPPELQFTHEITIADLDRDAYDAKFKFADAVKAMKNPHPKYLARIFKDPTLFSYYLLKHNAQPVKLYIYQDAMLNDPHRFIIFRSARQVGKSWALDVKAVHNFCIDHGRQHNECIISKSLPQAQFQMRRVKALLRSSKFRWNEAKGDDTMMLISRNIYDPADTTFKKEHRNQKILYSNMLRCVPATEGSLGFDFHEVNLDETEYWDCDLEYMFNRVIAPTTYHTKGRICSFSSPNGSDNLIAKLELETTPDGTRKWHTYVFSFMDCPANTELEFEELRRTLSRHDFESNVLALRTSSDAAYFTREEIDRSAAPSLTPMSMIGKQPYFFLDIGSTHDQSALIGGYVEWDAKTEFNHAYITHMHLYPVGYPIARVAGLEVTDDDGWHHETSVKEYLEMWTDREHGIIPIFGFDVTGNMGMKALFDAMNIDAQDVTFTGPNKSMYYQRLKYFMEKGLLHRLAKGDAAKVWERQASDLIATKSQRGYLLINAASVTKRSYAKTLDAKLKRIPDDLLDSTAGWIGMADPAGYIDVPSVEVFG
jgi:hypothetical protein